MMRSKRHALSFSAIVNLVFAGVVVGALLVSVQQSPSVTHEVSDELKFSDASPSGLAIVPASCNSDPHFAGECDIANPVITGYSCNAQGTSVTISFTPVSGGSGGLFGMLGNQGSSAASYAARGDMNPSSYSGVCSSMNPGDYCNDAISANATSFTFTTTPGSPYSVWMHAINGAGGWSSGSNTLNFTCSGGLPAPASMTYSCSPLGTSAILQWSSVQGATAYYVRYSTSAGSCAPGWTMHTDGTTCYRDSYGQTSGSIPVVPGTNYNAWVHSGDPVNWSSQASTGVFSCSCPAGQVAQGGQCVALCANGLNSTQYPSCSCPLGQIVQGGQCVDTSCQNGLNINQYPTCSCPSGYTAQGGQCIAIDSCQNGLNINQYPTCSCPSGYTLEGGQCVSPTDSCVNGLNVNQYPTCSCPIGYSVVGGQCVSPTGSCTNGLDYSQHPTCSCPIGQVVDGGQCVPEGTASCPNGLNITQHPTCSCPIGQVVDGGQCVPEGTASCPNGLNITQYPSCQCPSGMGVLNNQCIAISCQNGLNVAQYPTCTCPAGMSVQSGQCVALGCLPGFTQSNGQCLRCAAGYELIAGMCYGITDDPDIVITPFVVPGSTVQASGNLEARPTLLRVGETSRLFWQATNVVSCSVTGTNGDSWNTTFSGSTGVQTSPILARTTYTLRCEGRAGAVPASLTQTKTINILPSWVEE